MFILGEETEIIYVEQDIYFMGNAFNTILHFFHFRCPPPGGVVKLATEWCVALVAIRAHIVRAFVVL